jgi:hypothetical protein
MDQTKKVKESRHFCCLWLICLTDKTFLRLEVRDMQVNYTDQWNLYMLGLAQLYQADQADPYSYYSLAGKLVSRND